MAKLYKISFKDIRQAILATKKIVGIKTVRRISSKGCVACEVWLKENSFFFLFCSLPAESEQPGSEGELLVLGVSLCFGADYLGYFDG